MSSIDLVVPDLGNFDAVPVVDVLVRPGDTIEVDAPLVTLETDKASMDVPATHAGKITEVLVKRGDKVGKGTVIARLEALGAPAPAASAVAPPAEPVPVRPTPAAPPPPETAGDTVRMPIGDSTVRMPVVPAAERTGSTVRMPAAAPSERSTQLLVLGAGPGGYTAAFRAADLGLKVTLVERWPQLGGVCLNVGCIPSKALLHAAKVIEDAHAMGANGIVFGTPKIDAVKLRNWKAAVVKKLTGGLKLLA